MAEFFRRLAARPPCRSFEEAYFALVSTLEQVEDELTGIENRPENWPNDGRLYPPQKDQWLSVGPHSDIVRMRTKGHIIFIAQNGAIKIQTARGGTVVFSKPGADGREVGHDE